MIDLDDVLAHAHDNCVACEGTGVVRCWSPGGPCPDGQTVCESCGPCQQSDVPALVAALREARAEVDRLRETMALAESVFMAEARASGQYEAERDDWRRRYEALRDGVTSLCDDPHAYYSDGRRWVAIHVLRVVVDPQHPGDES